jgi:histidine triad (HIT) family protein
MQNQSESSIFTKIINREIPADIVYEDDTVLAFLDIQPINIGHTLIIPKVPFVNIFDGDAETLGYMMQVAQKIGIAMTEVKLAEGVNIVMNNGHIAGQEVFHAHLHVIPRHENDKVFIKPRHVDYSEGQMAKTATKLSTILKQTAPKA